METLRKYWNEWRVGYWLLGAGSAVFVAVTLLLIAAYALPSSSVRPFRASLPLPVALISGGPAATYADVSENLSALRTFYESQDFSSLGLRVDFSTPEGEDRLRIQEREIVGKMIEDAAIRRLAAAEGISFSDQDALRTMLDKAESEDGIEAARVNISRLYGWDLERFAHYVVLPDLYSDAVEARFSADRSRFADAGTKAGEAERMLADGRTFEDVSKELSDGRTAVDGGDMGWFAYDQLAESLREPARTQSVGMPGRAIESPLGFHILLVNERKTEGEDELVNLSQIFVRKPTFGDWLTERMREMDVRVLDPTYEWDRETATVRFRDERLRKLEQETLDRSEGDVSVIF